MSLKFGVMHDLGEICIKSILLGILKIVVTTFFSWETLINCNNLINLLKNFNFSSCSESIFKNIEGK